jgi:hypothetical protein
MERNRSRERLQTGRTRIDSTVKTNVLYVVDSRLALRSSHLPVRVVEIIFALR